MALMTSGTSQADGIRPIDPRLRISALWIAVLLIFVYVDLFSLYRRDVRDDIEAGKIGGFEINQTFLFLTTLYIVVPALMIYLALVMRPQLNRVVNIVVAAVYAVTVAGSAVGEWGYYILGSALEVVLLALVVRTAWGLWEASHSEVLSPPGREA